MTFDRCRDDGGDGAAGAVSVQGFGEVDVDDRVATEDGEGAVEEAPQILDAAQAAGGALGPVLQAVGFEGAFEGVGHVDAEAAAVAEVLLDLWREVAGVDDDLIEAVGA